MSVLQPTRDNLLWVANEISEGRLAILPTETVYGLAADANNPEAVANIFKLKGRPADNPLIVHIASVKQIEQFASAIPESVQYLAEAFMPGPLTLVLPKRPTVSDILTAGLDTVAIRLPDHPACLAVMELGSLALAMPSANLFMGLSPTRVEMIDLQLAKRVAAVVDGGPCAVGIESTVLDLTGEPTILREGSVTRQNIESVLNRSIGVGAKSRKSPGMYKRHYASRTKCKILLKIGRSEPGLVFEEPANENQIQMPKDPSAYAHLLYASLADLDSRGLTEFFVEPPPDTHEWIAVWDRLSKATY